MSKDLMITELEKNFLTVSEDKPEYKVMATNIKEKMPAIQQASSNFYKSHSQFMNVMLDVTAITPIRSIKHSLAEVEKTRSALQDAYFSVEKNKIEIKMKELEVDVFKLETEDIQDARKAFSKDWTSRIVGVLIIVGFLAYIFTVTLMPPDQNSDTIVSLVLGYLGGLASAIISFYFGASQSNDKND